MKLLDFRAVRKGALRGFAAIELSIGLKINDIAICESHGKAWAGLPGKPQIDKDGRPIRDERGKLAYSAVLEWRDKRLRDAFSERVVEIVRAAHPDAFDNTEQGGAP